MKAIILALLLSLLAIGAHAAIGCTTPSPSNTSISYVGHPSNCATNTPTPCLVNDTMFFSAVANGYSFGCEGHNYFWDFGDGFPGSGQSVMHTYTNPGIYTVTLTLTSELSPTLVVTQVVNVALVAPATSRTTLMILILVLGAIAVVRLR
jgi:PKD repeat protein